MHLCFLAHSPSSIKCFRSEICAEAQVRKAPTRINKIWVSSSVSSSNVAFVIKVLILDLVLGGYAVSKGTNFMNNIIFAEIFIRISVVSMTKNDVYTPSRNFILDNLRPKGLTRWISRAMADFENIRSGDQPNEKELAMWHDWISKLVPSGKRKEMEAKEQE